MRDRHVAILASAGTGKTFQLSGRYVGLLLGGVAPERILATTFTRKAAGEILARVLTRLGEGAASAAGAAKTARELESCGWAAPGDGGALRGRCAEALERVAGVLDRLWVCTIDSFLSRVASGAALDLGLPAGWRIEEDEEPLRAEALAAMVRGAAPSEMLELVRVLAAGEHRSSVSRWLRAQVDAAHAAYLAAGPGAWGALGPPPFDRLDEGRVAAAAEAVRRLPVPVTKAGQPHRAWRRQAESIARAALDGDWAGLAQQGLIGKLLLGEGEYSRVPIPPAWETALRPLIDHARAVVLGRHAGATAALRDLVERFDAALRELKRRRGVLHFGDVTERLLGAGLAGDLDALYYRLDGRIDHLLLDEFQDTSVDQFRLIAPMLEELVSGGDRSVLCVGDAKQSLYQWRRAEPELLAEVPRRWPQVAARALAQNRRSSPTILACVDRVLGGVGENPALAEGSPERDAARRWAGSYAPHEPARDDRGLVVLEEAAPAADGTPAWARTLRHGAERAARVSREAPWATVGVLTRTRRAVALLVHMLRRQGVDASEEGGSPLNDAPAVGAALSALRVIDHPGDRAACFHVATSPLGPVLGLERWDDPARAGRVGSALRARIAAEGLAPVLAEWMDRVAGCCSALDLRRFEQLVALAAAAEARRTPRLAEFAALVERTPVESPTPGRVRVMTVHQSKGLEFDAVVLPELDRPIPGPTPAVLVERDGPLTPPSAVCRYARDWVRALDPSGRLERMARRRRERDFGEVLCLLYVAMTRARRALFMVVPPEGARQRLSCAKMLRAALAPERAATGAPAPGAVLWRDGDEGWAHDRPASAAEPGPAPPARPLRLSLRPADRGAIRHLPRVSPSAAGEGRRVDAARLLSAAESLAARRGRMIHAWLRRVGWLEDGAPGDDALAADAREAFPSGHPGLERDRAAFRALLGDGPVAALLRRSAYAGRAGVLRLDRERAFAMRSAGPDGRGVLVEGRIDRLVVGLDAGRAVFAEVIDFKTDAAPDEAARLALVARHAPQVRAYRAAVARAWGLEPAAVAARIVFTEAAAVHDVPAEGP